MQFCAVTGSHVGVTYEDEGKGPFTSGFGNDNTQPDKYFFADNDRVLKEVDALKNGDFETFKSYILESGDSSYKYNQNVFSVKKPQEQPVSLALAVSESILKGKGAWRVHGGGFAGTIQAFVPVTETENYVSSMKKVFGENSCYILKVRSHGGCEI